MLRLKFKKSFLLLIFLILSTSLIHFLSASHTAFTVMSFFTFITGLYIIFKYLEKKHENKWLKRLRILFRISLLAMGLSSVFILTLVSIPQFSCSKIPDQIMEFEYMVVLGAGLKEGNELSHTLKMRLDKTLGVFGLNPNLIIVVSGGQGPDETVSEAKAMKHYLVQNGIPSEKIIMEDQSRSTYENLLLSKKKLKEENQFILVTTNFHMFRAQMIGQKLDINPTGVCSSTHLHLIIIGMIREIPAVINDALGNVLK